MGPKTSAEFSVSSVFSVAELSRVCLQSKRQIPTDHLMQRMPRIHEHVMHVVPLASLPNLPSKFLHRLQILFPNPPRPVHSFWYPPNPLNPPNPQKGKSSSNGSIT